MVRNWHRRLSALSSLNCDAWFDGLESSHLPEPISHCFKGWLLSGLSGMGCGREAYFSLKDLKFPPWSDWPCNGTTIEFTVSESSKSNINIVKWFCRMFRCSSKDLRPGPHFVLFLHVVPSTISTIFCMDESKYICNATIFSAVRYFYKSLHNHPINCAVMR